ncbi:MAG TPA: hypothetical protein VII37_05065 [Candidatus Acidoferrum sp.]
MEQWTCRIRGAVRVKLPSIPLGQPGAAPCEFVFEMSQATAMLRDFAERLIAFETTENLSFETKQLAGFLVVEKLRLQLATVMGSVGIRALLSRALALATAEVPWLGAVHVRADGSLEGLDKLETELGPKKLAEGGAVLLVQLLGLLVAFIGERLTLQLIRESWPNFSLSDLNFASGDMHDNPK